MKTIVTNLRVGMLWVAFAAAFATLPVCNAQETSGTVIRTSDREKSARIRGTVFDSLLMKAVPHATVTLLGASRSMNADSKGQFDFGSVAAGQQQVAFSTPAFDSLGLGMLGASVTAQPGEDIRMTIATPSMHTLWSYRCAAANTFGTDSGVVWGTVRDAATNEAVAGATASFNWYEIDVRKLSKLSVKEVRREIVTDNSGMYFACGLPISVSISAQAIATAAASGRVEYAIGDRRIHRVDLLVSRDMVVINVGPFRAHDDTINVTRVHGRSTLRGLVVDEKQRPLADATVMVASVDTMVRTDINGNFVLRALPAGTHALNVRRVGAARSTRLVDLRPDSTTDIVVSLSNVNALAAVNIRADKSKGKDRIDFEFRKKLGWARVVEGDALKRGNDMYSVLSAVGGLDVRRSGDSLAVKMNSAGTRCTPEAFIDGVRSATGYAVSFTPENYRAIEVYQFHSTAPAEYSTTSSVCGVILLWTKQARW